MGPWQGIEIGSGFSGSRMLGSEHNDEFYMTPDGEVRTRTNRCASSASLALGLRAKSCGARGLELRRESACLVVKALAIVGDVYFSLGRLLNVISGMSMRSRGY